MIKQILFKILEFFGILRKTNSDTTTDTSDSTDVTIKVEENEDNSEWFEYVAFDEYTIEAIKDVFRPIIKNYYSGEGKNVYYEFMKGIIRRIKVYCTISEDGKLLSIRFSLSDSYSATQEFESFINEHILKDFYSKIENTSLANIPLEIKLENGVLKVRLVKFLEDN